MSNYNADWAMIAQQINNAEWGQKEVVKQRFCDRLGIDRSTLHRYLARVQGKQKTIDRGFSFDPENRLCRMIFDMKIQGEMMHLKRRELATEECIKLLIDMGVEGSDELYSIDNETGEIRYKVSTVNRRLRDMGFRDPQPSKRIEADYANQVHMIDFSRSKYFQLWERDERTGEYKLKVSGKELHYKKSDTRLRTWIVQYMDDFSRLRKVRAYPETNESAFLGLEHLNYVYGGSSPQPPFEGGVEPTPGPSRQRVATPCSSGENPLHYLPLEMLRCDNGSFRRSRETQAAMEALEITMPPQMPGSKGGTAKVENRFRSLWQQFELPLAVRIGDGGTIWMSEYNELLEEFCIKEMEKQHPVKKDQTKGDVYLSSLADRSIPQKTTDADMIRIACRIERRVVDAHLRVSVDNQYYSVPQYVAGIPTMGKTVAIHRNKYGELTGKLIEDEATQKFELTEWRAAKWGVFSSFEQTEKRKREDEMNRENTRFSDIIGESGDKHTPENSAERSVSGHLSRGESSYPIKRMPPRVDDVKADSAFASDELPTGRVFRSVLKAREYVGAHVKPIGLSWKDVDSYFDDLLNDTPILEYDIQMVLEKIYEDFDNGSQFRDTANY